MATAVLCLAVSLFPFEGPPVASLRFPVNPASSQVAAGVRTIGLASKAPATYAEPQTAEAAADLHQKQKNGLRPCKPSEAMVKIRCLWSFRSLAELSSKPEVTASGFPFIPSQKPIGGLGRDGKKDNPLLSGWQTAGQNPEYLIGGSDFLAKGGSR